MNTLSMSQFIEILPLLAPIILIEIGLMIFSLVKVLKQTQFKYLNKVIWIVIVVFIQIIGPIIYLVVERGDQS